MTRHDTYRRAAAAAFLLPGLLGLATVAAAGQKTHVYETEGGAQPGNIRKVGTYSNGGYKNVSVICSGGRNCTEVSCNACHTGQKQTLTAAEGRKHLDIYYPRAQVQLQPGQAIDFAGMKLRSANGRLEFLDGKGRRYALPADARLLRDRAGRASLLMVTGDTLALTPIPSR